jgi:hypothetical protein
MPTKVRNQKNKRKNINWFLTRRSGIDGDWWFVDNGGRDILTRDPSGFVRYVILAGVVVVVFSFVADEIKGPVSFWSFVNWDDWEISPELLISFSPE